MGDVLRHTLAGLFVLLLSTLPAAAEEVIRLAHDDPFAPFAMSKGGRSEGIVIDILQEALARGTVKPVFIPAHMDKVQDLVKAGEADGLALLAVNPERQQVYDFSDPLVITGGALFVGSPRPAPAGLQELEGKRVVTPRKGPLAGYIQRQFPKVDLLTVEDYPAALKAVLDGTAEAAALNPQVGMYLAGQLFPGRFTSPPRLFLELPLAAAVLKGTHASFLEQLNAGLSRIRAEGAYARIIEKWGGR
jgi:polar amino acid transport system substrate-binding protein